MIDYRYELDKVKQTVLDQQPLPIDPDQTFDQRCLKKEVIESRLLDDMQTPDNWQLLGPGNMTFSRERSTVGQQSLRLTAKTKIATEVGPDDPENYGRPFAEVVCRRSFAAEDWTNYNRLSFWVYPTLPGFKTISMYAMLHNEGEIKLPDAYLREGLHFFLLEPDRWNQVIWEIPSLARDQVTAVDIIYRMQGNEPGATDTVCFDIDQLELQTVAADPYEGWSVAPGKLAYSQTGYAAGGQKTAIASDIDADQFELIAAPSGEVVLRKPVAAIESSIGSFQTLDFSEHMQTGSYYLKAGSVKTEPFRIAEDVWQGTIWKTINQYFCQRCGYEVPGIHGICHRDWRCEHEDEQIVINGGWHDAGDLSQGVCNTAESVYALFSLAESSRKQDETLRQRLIEEARWGLDWVLKTRFKDGYRAVWATMDFWTDGIMGTFDDITHQAHRSIFDNFVSAATEALAARVLKDLDPDRSRYSLQAAQEDFHFAKDGLAGKFADERGGSPEIQKYAQGILAATELYQATEDPSYLDKAVDWADYVMRCQQRRPTAWEIALNGFFYEDEKQKVCLRYPHRSHAQAPVVALAELCRLLPQHANYASWYTSLHLYANYVQKIAQVTAPYHMLPCSIYSTKESDDPDFIAQVKSGIRLSDEHYLRIFPVWFVFRGNSSVILSDAKALASAARQIRQPQLFDLCQQQLQWHVGRNPFAQSLMYGEGKDYAPQYTAMSGNIAGTLPVGVQTSREKDLPYWPFNNCYNYKEVWVQPSARWLWLMQDLAATATLRGTVLPGQSIRLTHVPTQNTFEFGGEGGMIQRDLPAGEYQVQRKNRRERIVLLPYETYDLDAKTPFSLHSLQQQQEGDQVKVTAKVNAGQDLKLQLRSDNIDLCCQSLSLTADANEQTIEITGTIKDPQAPWLILLLPDGKVLEQEVVSSEMLERIGAFQ